MNKKSSDDNSDFVKRDIITKLEKKEFPAKAPLGYLNISKNGIITGKQYDHKKQELLQTLGRPLQRIEKDPVMAPLLRKVFDLALTGEYGLNALREEAMNLGIVSKNKTMLSKSMMKKILNNPFYSGEFEYYGKLWTGNYEPIISKDEFNKIQVIQGNRSRPKKTKREYLFSMLIKCEKCGNLLCGDHQKGHDYLRCSRAKGNSATCDNTKHHQQEKINEEVIKKLADVHIPKSIVEWGLKQLEMVYEEEAKDDCLARGEIQKNISILKKQKTNLTQKWISSDLISDSEYREMKEDIEKGIKKGEESLKSLDNNDDNWFKRCQNFFEIAHTITEKYNDKKTSIKEKRVLLNTISNNFILTDGEFNLELDICYSRVRDANRQVKSIRTMKKAHSKRDKSISREEMEVWQSTTLPDGTPPYEN